MTNRTSLGYVVDQLQQDVFAEEELTIDSHTFDKQNDAPWFIQGLMGCGGWLAAMFTLGIIGSFIALFFSDLDETSIGILLMIPGAIFVAGTTVTERNNGKNGVFLTQLLLTIHVAGHILLVYGAVMAFELWRTDTTLVMALIYTIALQVIFIYLYPNAIYRFIAMLVIAGSIGGISYLLEMPLLISIATGVLVSIAILIWADQLSERWQINYLRIFHPIGYGSIIGAFGLMIYEVSNRDLYYDFVPATTSFITTFILFACLLVVLMQLLEEYEIPLTSRTALILFGASAVISLPIITTPGIIAGVIGILLAFRRRNRILLGISYLYLAGFIIYYYYWLDVSLLTKSFILTTTGILLILVRLLLRRIVIIPNEEKGLSA